MIDIKFDKVFLVDEKRMIGLQEYQRFEQPDGSIKEEKVNAIMLIEANGDSLQWYDPDGAEKDYWLNKIGLLSDKEFQAKTSGLKVKEERRALYDLLKQEYEAK